MNLSLSKKLKNSKCLANHLKKIFVSKSNLSLSFGSNQKLTNFFPRMQKGMGVRYYSDEKKTIDAEIVDEQIEVPVNKELKDDEQEPTLGETETVTSDYEQLGFQAETLKLLDIVTHSIYSNKEVFLRELISNASDALEKLRQLQISGREIMDNYIDLEVQISCDPNKKQLIIQDFGVGMSKEELIKNLGTIAHSGTKQFLEEISGNKQNKDASNIIGQFGVNTNFFSQISFFFSFESISF